MAKVLHVVNWLRRGGVETQLLQILRNYDRSLFHMDVCCFGSEPGYLESLAREFGAEILHCPKSANLFSFSKRFHNLISGKRYDIVHCHSETWSGPILRGAKYAGVPARIAHIRSSLPQGFRLRNQIVKLGRNIIVTWGRYWLTKYATHILGVSASALDKRFPQWKESKKYSLWTLGVDTQRFKPKKRVNNTACTDKVIINVGSFIPQRKQDMLIRIHTLLLERLSAARLVLVGEGENLNSCKNLAQGLGIDKKVDFMGLRDDIPDLLNNSDIFVSCSDAEGLPNAVLEAQASGLPVVASDIPPHRESIHRSARAFLFKHDDIKAAADKIIYILTDPGIYANLSRTGREHIITRYNSIQNLNKLYRIYFDSLDGLK